MLENGDLFYEFIMIVYKITNVKNKKVYIGKDIHGNKRIQFHKNALKGGYHPNKHLQNAWTKYGESCFIFEIIDKLTKEFSEQDLALLEKQRILEHDSTNPSKGYNKTFGGEGCLATQQTKQKMRDRSLGRKVLPKTRKTISSKIKHLWETGVYANRKSNSEVTQSEEYKNKISIAARPNGWKDIVLISPEGNVYNNIINLKTFCKENKLHYRAMRNTIVLSPRIDKKPRTYRGWKIIKVGA